MREIVFFFLFLPFKVTPSGYYQLIYLTQDDHNQFVFWGECGLKKHDLVTLCFATQ